MYDLDNLLLSDARGEPLVEGLHGLFPPVGGEEAARGVRQHRLVWLVNKDPSPSGVMNLLLRVEGTDQVTIARDPRPRPTAQPPEGLTFSDHLTLARLRPGERAPVWVRRTVPKEAALAEYVPLALSLECDVV